MITIIEEAIAPI